MPSMGGRVMMPISDSLTLGYFFLALAMASRVFNPPATTLLPTNAPVKPAYSRAMDLGTVMWGAFFIFKSISLANNFHTTVYGS